jgi:hypothetical protein
MGSILLIEQSDCRTSAGFADVVIAQPWTLPLAVADSPLQIRQPEGGGAVSSELRPEQAEQCGVPGEWENLALREHPVCWFKIEADQQ